MRDKETKREVPGIFRLKDLNHVGLTRARLRGMVHRGEAEKVGRGLYRRMSDITELDTVATVCARIPHGVVCLLTALIIHQIGTQLPREVWIAIDRKARKPRAAELPVHIVRFSRAMLQYGIEERRVQGVVVRITSPARTVVDCFRYRNKVGMDVALEALKDSLRTRRVSVDALASQWILYLKRSKLTGANADFSLVGVRVRDSLEAPARAVSKNEEFALSWPPGGPWR